MSINSYILNLLNIKDNNILSFVFLQYFFTDLINYIILVLKITKHINLFIFFILKQNMIKMPFS